MGAAVAQTKAEEHIISDAQVLPQQGLRGSTSAIVPVAQPSAGSLAVAQAPAQATGVSAMGVSSLVFGAILVTTVLCCVLACCAMKSVCGCLFGGVEDAFDGDGHIGATAQAEEAGLAGLGGYELAKHSMF